MKKYVIGEKLTLVSRGLQRSEYTNSTWIDERQKGRTSYLKLEKIGEKYICGRYIYIKDNKEKLCEWQAKIDPNDYEIHLGICPDLKQRHQEFLRKLDEHEEAREEKKRELERLTRKYINEEMEKWEKQNPRPINRI